MLNLEEVIEDTNWHLGAIHEILSKRVFPPPGEDTDKAKEQQDNPQGKGKGKRKTASRGNAARETRRGRGMTVTTRSIPRSDKYRKPIGPPLNLMRRVPPSWATHL